MKAKNLLFDYHVQTLDHGKNQPLRIEKTIEAAISRGLISICLTDHYPLPPGFVDPTEEKDCAMPLSQYRAYRKRVEKARKKYGDRLDIFVGTEFDWLPNYQQWTKEQINRWQFDYLIGSVHFLGNVKNTPCPKGMSILEQKNFLIDYTEEEFLRGVQYYGDTRKLVGKYYTQVCCMAKSGLFDSIGHLDLIKKYNDGGLFNEDEPWYREAVLATLDTIAARQMAMEINTAGWDKKCRAPYPSNWIIKEAHRRNIPLTIGSDAHTPETIGRNLEKAADLAREAGYQSLTLFINRNQRQIAI